MIATELVEKQRDKLFETLHHHYTSEEIEEFAWNVDRHTDDNYSFDFIDHTGSHKLLSISTKTGAIDMKEAVSKRPFSAASLASIY
jgi:hypothetical protein